jgi:hypothetical protein
MCKHNDCFTCPYHDCISSVGPGKKEQYEKYTKPEKTARQIAVEKYNKSEKGQARKKAYNKSEKRKAANARYAQTESYKQAQARYKAKRKAELVNALRKVKNGNT